MTTRTLSYPSGMKVCTLKHDITGGIIRSTSLSAKYTCDTHGFGFVANAQIMLIQCMLLTIKSNKLSTTGLCFHMDSMSLYHICIKTMHGLAIRHHHIIRDVNDIIDWSEPYCCEFLFQPLWTLLHLTAHNTKACISGTCFLIMDFHMNRQVMIVNLKFATIWSMKFCGIAITFKPCI